MRNVKPLKQVQYVHSIQGNTELLAENSVAPGVKSTQILNILLDQLLQNYNSFNCTFLNTTCMHNILCASSLMIATQNGGSNRGCSLTGKIAPFTKLKIDTVNTMRQDNSCMACEPCIYVSEACSTESKI